MTQEIQKIEHLYTSPALDYGFAIKMFDVNRHPWIINQEKTLAVEYSTWYNHKPLSYWLTKVRSSHTLTYWKFVSCTYEVKDE